MCGIVGYVGEQQSAPILVSGLKKLEYRGYDSAGLAVVNGGSLSVVRATGKLRNLEARVSSEPPSGTLGIGHTRWATHGRPTDENAHPHTHDGVAVVHNGIIENHLELKAMLKERGHIFASETDTEVFAHLIAAELQAGKDLPEAVRGAIAQVKGTYGLAVVWAKDPDRIVATKDSSPMVIGLSEGQNFVASDVPALLEHTRDMVFLEEGDLAVLSRTRVDLYDREGRAVNRPTRRIDWTPMMAEKGGHKHFMHKEIWEQPRALADTLRGRVLLSEGDVFFEGWTLGPEEVRQLSRVTLLACGTSWHSALVGRAMIESLARIPVDVELASEFRYRDPLVEPGQLAVAVSQSGETLDTLCALREATARGARTVALCNVVGSAMTRAADLTVLTNAGPEIGVASTKAFTTQLAALYLLAVKLGRLRGTLDVGRAQELLTHLTEVPKRVEEALHCESAVKRIARNYQTSQDFLFLGRGPMFPVALEGALKLKEISYIHAEGYAGGEMKHGPIALIDEKMPVMVIAPYDRMFKKTVSNLKEVESRGGKVVVLTDDPKTGTEIAAHHTLTLPKASHYLTPIVMTIPLQLLAYYIAV